MINMVEENLKFLSLRKFERAKKSRKLFEAMDTPTLHDLKAMIRMKLIRNNKGTPEYVNLAKKAFGPDVGDIKARTTIRRPTPVVSNVVEISDELLQVQNKVVLSMDGLEVNLLKTLTRITHNITYWTAHYLTRSVEEVYKKCLTEVYTN